MAIFIRAAACSNKGRVRMNNEDNFYLDGLFMDETQRDQGGLFNKDELSRGLFAVCDGMGGEEAGEEASLLSVKLCDRYRKEGMSTQPEKLAEFLKNGCKEVLRQARENGNHSGATIAMLIAAEDGLYAANMGDSRIYRLVGKGLEQVSEDHTEIQRLLRKRLITPAQAKTHPKRHMILQYWGMPLGIAPFQPFISRKIPYAAGERFLICSDGLTDMVENNRIAQLLRQRKSIKDITQELVDEALQNGGKDNVTVLILEVCDSEGTVEPNQPLLMDDSLQKLLKPVKGWWFATLALGIASMCVLMRLAELVAQYFR